MNARGSRFIRSYLSDLHGHRHLGSGDLVYRLVTLPYPPGHLSVPETSPDCPLRAPLTAANGRDESMPPTSSVDAHNANEPRSTSGNSGLDMAPRYTSQETVEPVAPANGETPGLLALRMSYEVMLASKRGFFENLEIQVNIGVSARDIAAALGLLPKDVFNLIKERNEEQSETSTTSPVR